MSDNVEDSSVTSIFILVFKIDVPFWFISTNILLPTGAVFTLALTSDKLKL